MDTWIFYAEVTMPYNDKAIDEYIEYAESEGFDLFRDVERTTESDGVIARMAFTKDTGIEVTGDDIEGGEPDEILFEPDDLDEDPNEWADVLNAMGADVTDAWFELN